MTIIYAWQPFINVMYGQHQYNIKTLHTHTHTHTHICGLSRIGQQYTHTHTHTHTLTYGQQPFIFICVVIYTNCCCATCCCGTINIHHFTHQLLLRNNNSRNNTSCVQWWILIVPQQQFASMAVMHGRSNGALREFVQYVCVSRGYDIPYAHLSAVPRTRVHLTTLCGRWAVTSRGVLGGY